MPRSLRDLVTVSPPTFDRCAFARLDRGLGAPQAAFDRAWLMARFAEGLQIRMLRAPLEGLVLFQPGRLSWRPIDGVDRTIVIHDLRVADGPDRLEASRRLWAGVEGFARYYGYAAVVAATGADAGLVSRRLAPGRGWRVLDELEAGGAALIGRFLHGPVAMPRLPRDWTARAARTGPGAVIQTTGESRALEARVDRLIRRARARGAEVSHERLRHADEARARAVSVGAQFSVLRDGCRIGGPEMTDAAILSVLTEGAAV